MKPYIAAAILGFAAVNLLAQPNNGAAKNKSNGTWYPPTPAAFVHNEIAAADAETPKASPPKWYASSEWWLVVIAGLTGLAILYQAREMARATEVMQRQLKEMQKAGEIQQRAYVCLDSAALTFPQPDVPEARVNFKNVGQTPAYDVRGWIHTWFEDYHLK